MTFSFSLEAKKESKQGPLHPELKLSSNYPLSSPSRSILSLSFSRGKKRIQAGASPSRVETIPSRLTFSLFLEAKKESKQGLLHPGLKLSSNYPLSSPSRSILSLSLEERIQAGAPPSRVETILQLSPSLSIDSFSRGEERIQAEAPLRSP